MHHYLLALSFNEFLDWYNRRTKAILGLRFIPVHVKGGVIEVDPTWEEWLMKSVPDYDDDFQVLFALVGLNSAPKKYKRITEKSTGAGREAAFYQEVQIEQVEGLYPITERGKRLLQNRIGSDVQLGSPLFEESVQQTEKERARQLSYRGGDALLDYFNLQAHQGEIDRLRDEVWEAVDLKVNEKVQKVDGEPFVKHLIVYDRHGKPHFPNSQLGYLYDYFAVVNGFLSDILEYSEHQHVVDELLVPARSKLDALREKEKDLWTALTDGILNPEFDRLSDFSKVEVENYPPHACVLFLNLRDQLRETDRLSNTNVDAWVEGLFGLNMNKELALGLWMTGAFFDFSKFADEYYAEWLEPPFMSSPPNELQLLDR